MKKRIDIYEVTPEAYKPLIDLEKHIAKSGLEKTLYHLIKVRASQINACHYCINMHTRDALKMGETTQRLFLLDAWWEAPELYSEKEQAALKLTEEITLIANAGVSDKVYEEAEKHFSEKQLSAVIMAIIAINAWNRLAITTKKPLD